MRKWIHLEALANKMSGENEQLLSCFFYQLHCYGANINKYKKFIKKTPRNIIFKKEQSYSC